MIARSSAVRPRYDAIALALLSRLVRDSRTSLGEPVEPDVLSRSRSSGWSAGSGRPVGAKPPSVQVGARAVGTRQDLVARQQHGVAAGERRQVGDDELDRRRRHQADQLLGGREPGLRPGDEAGEVVVREHLGAGERAARPPCRPRSVANPTPARCRVARSRAPNGCGGVTRSI